MSYRFKLIAHPTKPTLFVTQYKRPMQDNWRNIEFRDKITKNEVIVILEKEVVGYTNINEAEEVILKHIQQESNTNLNIYYINYEI